MDHLGLDHGDLRRRLGDWHGHGHSLVEERVDIVDHRSSHAWNGLSGVESSGEGLLGDSLRHHLTLLDGWSWHRCLDRLLEVRRHHRHRLWLHRLLICLS